MVLQARSTAHAHAHVLQVRVSFCIRRSDSSKTIVDESTLAVFCESGCFYYSVRMTTLYRHDADVPPGELYLGGGCVLSRA